MYILEIFEELLTKNDVLQIGHFPYAVKDLNGITYYKFKIPLKGVPFNE